MWYFLFFLVSGFCGILYELVWLRLAMAQFGVTTPLVSIVLSMFMAGLGVGSIGAGAWVRRYGSRILFPPLFLYATAELLIGVSSFVVPAELALGHRVLEAITRQTELSSVSLYLLSGGWLGLTLVPWCACMGATIPLAMFAIRRDASADASRSFSFLYLANVLGAIAGAVLPLFLIELYGFHGTLHVGAMLNVAIATTAFLTGSASRGRTVALTRERNPAPTVALEHGNHVLVLLFMTGLATMGMELVWIRLFTPYLGSVVYSFATILAFYLLATFAGSRLYRLWSRSQNHESRLIWISLTLVSLLPLLTSDSRIHFPVFLRVVLGIMPVSGVFGFLTPMLVDRWSGGDPDRAGRAYAVNVVGCIVGPLISGFILLPLTGERFSMFLFALPWCVLPFLDRRPETSPLATRAGTAALLTAAAAVFFLTKDYETRFPQREVLRDDTATVIAAKTASGKKLLVNGVGMTSLTPTTKMMAHFPLASLGHPANHVLVICFGMGTTFRSALTWGVPVTAVDLVPSVPRLFHYFHSDAPQILASPQAHIVVDDGRRYLERNPTTYDLVIIDPPPPVEAAGSSLLYSEEFYALAKQRLQPGGILAQWLPYGDRSLEASVARALQDSFPYVRVFPSVVHIGWHFFASDQPIASRGAEELVARMPAKALTDMMEWGPAKTPTEQFNLMLAGELATEQMIALSPQTLPIQDDRPVNEYFLLRRPTYVMSLVKRGWGSWSAK